MDIDFAVAGRERVINYVTEKYGRDRVAQIITFSTMAARAAVRDAGRVLEVPYGVVDRIAKLIPEGPGQTLDECLKPGAELRRAVDTDPVAREIVELAKPLEGLTRADSIHAAGVVIGAEPLIDVVPLQQKAAELAGGVDIAKIPLDDPAVYEMLSRGEATGVFQFESAGMREALRQVRPTEFEDLIALVALYRPGPMQYIPVYANRKHGREPVTYADPRLKAVASHTYGICLAGDTLVFEASTGRRRRIDSLAAHEHVLVQGVDAELRPAHAPVTRWFDNGVKPVYRLRLGNGATIKATANHEFLTERGWRRLEELRPGDRVGTPSKLDLACAGRTLDERGRARLRVLAHLLADGPLRRPGPPPASSAEPVLVGAAEEEGGRAFAEVAVPAGGRARRVARPPLGRDRLSAAGVPEEVFELADEEVARFLGALWDRGGHVGEDAVFFRTASRRLARDLQTLLLRLGIPSQLLESTDANGGGERTAYQVTPQGTSEFARLVRPWTLRRKPAPETASAGASPAVERAPAPARPGLPPTARAARVSWQEIVAIEDAGEERVYDIEVAGVHNFVANNVIVHNCIYQEQAMEIAKQVAGFTPGEADDLRKAIAKKNHKLMASLKDKFIEGCIAN